MRLTSRGVGLLASAGVMLLAAALFGIQELYAIAVAIAALVAGAAVWTRAVRWDLRTSRALTPSRLQAGSEAVVELSVHNASARRSPIVALRDRVDGRRSSVTLALGPLDPQTEAQTSYRVPAPVRGIFAIGPLDVELADPFGLVAASRPGVRASALVVHPRVVDLTAPGRSTGPELDALDSWATVRPAEAELATIREYRTGDDLRRVHWASTARLAELMVRQEEAAVDGRLTVAVDLRQPAWAAGGLETALAAAASVLAATLRQGIEGRLVTSIGATTGFGTGAGHRAAALDLLAAATTSPADRQVERLRAACAAGPAVLITTDLEPGRQVLASLTATRSLTAVLVRPDGAPGGVAAAPDTGPRVLVIDTVDALARQWRAGRVPGP